MRLSALGGVIISFARFSFSLQNIFVCYNGLQILWARRDLNPQPLRDTVLSRTRIPVPPLAHRKYKMSIFIFEPSLLTGAVPLSHFEYRILKVLRSFKFSLSPCGMRF